MMETKKIDEFTIEVTKEIPAKAVAQRYDYSFLLSQKKAIEEDLSKYTAARQAELSEVNALIAECEKFGIKAKEGEKEMIS